ncbi:MAG: coproporphyrinogen III oxidase family protein, partial [Pseudomonadota bacterium]
RALGQGRMPIAGQEELTEEQIRLEIITLGLRTRAGLDLGRLGDNLILEKILSGLVESEWAAIIDNHVVPTLKGFLVADRLPLLFC